MKCDVSKSPSEPTFAPLQPTSPSFGTSALDGGPSDGVTVTLRDEALHIKTLSKEALAARNDRRLYAWPCPEEPTTDLTEFEHCVSTKVQNRRNSQILFAWREVLVRKFPCGACRRKRSGRIQEDLFVRSCDAMALELWDASVSRSSKMMVGTQHFSDWLLNKAEDFDDGQAYRTADGFKCRWLASSTTTLPAGRTLRETPRRAVDRFRRTHLPSVTEQGATVNKAIGDIEIICRENVSSFKKTSVLPAPIRRALHAALAGIFAWRTCPGRPGELELLPVQKVQGHGCGSRGVDTRPIGPLCPTRTDVTAGRANFEATVDALWES